MGIYGEIWPYSIWAYSNVSQLATAHFIFNFGVAEMLAREVDEAKSLLCMGCNNRVITGEYSQRLVILGVIIHSSTVCVVVE